MTNAMYWLLNVDPVTTVVVSVFTVASVLTILCCYFASIGARNMFEAVMSVWIVGCITAVLILSNLTEGCTRPCFMVSRSQVKIPTFLPRGVAFAFWKFDPRYDDVSLVELPLTGKAAQAFHSVTDNPKVRHIKYHVRIKIDESKADSGKWYGIALSDGSVDRWVEYQLFEFNERKSNEIAVLYNPLDESQQARFRQLFKEFIGPKLSEIDGLLDSATFTIETGESKIVYAGE